MRQEIHKNLPRAGTKKRAWFRRGMYALLSLVVLGVLWSGYAYWKIESAESSPAEKADVGIILGASMWGDQPSPDCGNGWSKHWLNTTQDDLILLSCQAVSISQGIRIPKPKG